MYTLPAGRYYVGDVSHVLPDRVYDTWCELLYCRPGRYCLNNKGYFVVHTTAFGVGVGEYIGSDNIEYTVVAGNIGMVHESLHIVRTDIDGSPIILNTVEGGSIYTFTGPVNYVEEGGCFTISCEKDKFILIIDTNSVGGEDTIFLP